MLFRNYEPDRDKETTHRIWRETGWIEKEKEEEMDRLVGAGRSMVAELGEEAESLVLSAPGTVRYLNEDLPFAGVTAVTTSRVARKQGLASRLTARVIAADAAEGALVSGLGMFEQGFYNQLGFGTGSYEVWTAFDPARLRVDVRARVPRRISADDWAAVHASRLARKRTHGAVSIRSPELTRAEMAMARKAFGLGYYDGPDGELTHHLWIGDRGEHGPYSVRWMSYRTGEQFLELMALLRNMGDQVRLVRMPEPPEIQLQDLIEQPSKQRQISAKSEYEAGAWATAWWQMRVNDLPGCMARTHLPGAPVRFHLHLDDPIAGFLDQDAPWRGTSGDYVVTLGPESEARPGEDARLPTLRASLGAFTRLWLGVRPATGLAVSDDLRGSPELLAALNETLRLPAPKIDWDL